MTGPEGQHLCSSPALFCVEAGPAAELSIALVRNRMAGQRFLFLCQAGLGHTAVNTTRVLVLFRIEGSCHHG